MVSISPLFSHTSSQMNGSPDAAPFALSKGIGSGAIMPTAAMPGGGDVLAFVPSPVPGTESTVLEILSRTLPGAAGHLLSGILSKISPVLFVLNTRDTADTTQMLALVRRLEAAGIDPREVAFGLLPNGNLGIYDRNDDSEFPHLVAFIDQGTGEVVTQRSVEQPALVPDGFNPFPPIGPSDLPPRDPPLRVPPIDPNTEIEESETPDDVTAPETQFLPDEVPVTDPNVLSPEAQERIDDLNAQRHALKERLANIQDQVDRLGDEVAQMEAAQRRIAEQGRLRQESRNIMTGLEREISGGSVNSLIGGPLTDPQHIEALAEAMFARAAAFEAEGAYEKALALIEAFLDRYEAHASDIPGSTPLLGGASQRGFERYFHRIEEELREAIRRSLGHSSFTDGTDPIEEVIEKHGISAQIMLHALAAAMAPEEIASLPDGILSAPSTAIANEMRKLHPKMAAGLVAALGDRLANLPQIYRIALAASLSEGDKNDPVIARAIEMLEAVASGGELSPELNPLSRDAETFVSEQIAAGKLTLEQFYELSALNPHLHPIVLIHRIMKMNRGEEVEDLRLSESDAIPEIDRSADILPPANMVHSWADIRAVLGSFGMYLADTSELSEEFNLAQHSEAEMCEIVNAAIPYLRLIAEKFPGALNGLSISVHAPNPPPAYPGDTGPLLGMGDTESGTIFLSTMLDYFQRFAERDFDGATKFMLTLFHEIGHAFQAKAPDEARDFTRNLSPVLEIYGGASSNAGEDAMSMDEALEKLFPNAPPAERRSLLFEEYEVRIEDVERMVLEQAGETIVDPEYYDGTLHVYRTLPADVTDIAGMTTSGYARTDGNEAFAEQFAHHLADRGYMNYPDTFLPHHTERARAPMPPNLEHLMLRTLFAVQNRDGPVSDKRYPEFLGNDN